MAQLKIAARAFEDRVGAWPLWKQSIVLIPAVVLLLSVLVVALYAVGRALPALERVIAGH